jgi:hypothetical protein
MSDDANQADAIQLSDYADALLDSLHENAKPKEPLEGEQYQVSDTVSFFGFAYEKMRNAIEFHEEHLIRRIAIARILRRRLAINPNAAGEGENLARELLWGRYIQKNSLTTRDINLLQKIIDSYLHFFQKVKETHRITNIESLERVFYDLLSSEIEENLSKEYASRKAAELYFFYQTLVQKISIENVPKEDAERYFYVAAEKALLKNDNAFVSYHLFLLRYGELHKLTHEEMLPIAKDFHIYLKETTQVLNNPYDDQLVKFAKNQAAPFRILYTILESHKHDRKEIVTSVKKLEEAVEKTCNEKYAQTGTKLRTAAIRSIIYIFMTKMIFVLIFEIPLSKLLYGDVELLSIGINTLFPPVLMGLIVSTMNPPSDKNTERIYNRIVDILNSDPGFETQTTKISPSRHNKRPILFLAFTVVYVLVFYLVFGGIYLFLDYLHFNLISKAIFMFFISVVAFFGYRIRQTAKEYVLDMKNSVLVSFVAFLFLPILYVGKFLSSQVSRINVFIIFFDYLFEAPFKFLIEIVEEWSRFLKARKDELL